MGCSGKQQIAQSTASEQVPQQQNQLPQYPAQDQQQDSLQQSVASKQIQPQEQQNLEQSQQQQIQQTQNMQEQVIQEQVQQEEQEQPQQNKFANETLKQKQFCGPICDVKSEDFISKAQIQLICTPYTTVEIKTDQKCQFVLLKADDYPLSQCQEEQQVEIQQNHFNFKFTSTDKYILFVQSNNKQIQLNGIATGGLITKLTYMN